MREHRRRFGAVVALVIGVFLALTLLPFNVTGPFGTVLGPGLWRMFGLGAIGAPLLGVLIGLAGFERLPRLDMKRTAILVVGLSLLVPYVIGVLSRVESAYFDPPTSQWPWPEILTGWLPGFLARTAVDLVGVAGGLLAGFVGLTAVTLGTLAWHPLQRFEGGEGAAAVPPWKPAPSLRPRPVEAVVEAAAEEAPVTQEDLFGGAARRTRRRAAEQIDIEEVIAPRPRQQDDALPPIDLLTAPRGSNADADQAELQRLGEKLLATLKTFKVDGTLAGFTSGPTVTQFEVVPAEGVKAGRIIALADDLAITMRATSLRAAPIPGRGAVGVEIPNPSPRIVTIRELLESDAWRSTTALLPIALGRDVEGKPVIADLARMPHLLVAGATGSGKSVAINTIVTSLIYQYTATHLRLLMIDPKMVELSMYNGLPHLRKEVVTNNHDAAKVLKWAVGEMNRRYALLHENGVRQLSEFNRKLADGKPLRNPKSARPTLATVNDEAPDTPPYEWKEEYSDGPLPMIVLIVDELADLMMTVQGEVETPLAILAQKSRAIGIHLILATQRPSVNVLTGLIKANFPSRIAFRVASKVDSRTILDQNGAEALLGNGDMLFLPPGRNEPNRVQGAYISTEETERLMEWHRNRADAAAATEADIFDELELGAAGNGGADDGGPGDTRDALFRQAAELCIQHQGGSTSLLQRRLGVGYGRAARIIDQLHDAGILGPPNGSKPRDVMVGLGQLDEYA
ncbi:MAG TPA: DNA translocase FtsK [Gemmatimonadales bacterium]|jgi:S-DNA-T family DNA segregation ATPase FtsK/SpoIIIE